MFENTTEQPFRRLERNRQRKIRLAALQRCWTWLEHTMRSRPTNALPTWLPADREPDDEDETAAVETDTAVVQA